jgi:hypothetical protein
LVTTDILQGCVGETTGESTSGSSNPEAQDVLIVNKNRSVEPNTLGLKLDIMMHPIQFMIKLV